jgi:type II secretory pathway pseudopilin PulG
MVSDEFAGQTGPCVSCGRRISVPAIRSPYVAAAPVPTGGRVSRVALAVIALVVVLVGLAVVALLMRPLAGSAIRSAVQASEASNCQGRMERILAALQKYHDDHGKYPPAYTVDAAGKKLHSWRVLILPYLGAEDLYSRINLNEPWDSPYNQAFHSQMPEEFGCPSSPLPGMGFSSYVVVEGPGHVFNGTNQTSISSITDGLSNTILIVEVADCDICWMEPKDFKAADLAFDINSDTADGISSLHGDGANVGLADGTAKRATQGMSPDELRALFTIAGGEIVPLW